MSPIIGFIFYKGKLTFFYFCSNYRSFFIIGSLFSKKIFYYLGLGTSRIILPKYLFYEVYKLRYKSSPLIYLFRMDRRLSIV